MKSWSGEDLLPSSYMVVGKSQFFFGPEASLFHHVGLSIGFLTCSQAMEVGFPQNK